MIIQPARGALRRIPFNNISRCHMPILGHLPCSSLQCRQASNIYDNLKTSGLIKSAFPDNLDYNQIFNKRQTIYAGFDPTAPSLHVGNLLVLITLLKLHRKGHRIIVLIGDSTAQIGDPSGKNVERPVLGRQLIESNAEGIFNDISKIRDKVLNKKTDNNHSFIICRNSEWYKNMNAIDFIGKFGRQLRMGDLLNKSSVRERLESPQGLSFGEFSYQLFQAYDWLHLFRKYGCRFQIGGVDQTVNIHNGHDMIKKVTNDHATYGLFMPLITDEKGNKIGKSEAGKAVYLDEKLTSHFNFFQYFMRLRDSDIVRFVRMFSLKPEAEIETMIQKQQQSPKPWFLQKKLAHEMTSFIHGESGLENAQRITEAFFSKDLKALGDLKPDEIEDVFGSQKFRLELEPGETSVLDVAMKTECFDSTKSAIDTIKEGGFHLNYMKVCNPSHIIDEDLILKNHITIVGVGKRNYRLVHWL